MTGVRTGASLTVVVVALVVVAWLAPAPTGDTDRPTYEAVAERLIITGCDQLHCFRVLVPWVLGRLPGPSLVKWRGHAVAGNAAAAAAVFLLCLTWGMSRRAAAYASVASAFGFGSLYTLFDAYTADPLMYALGPALLVMLARGSLLAAGATAAVGILAKEFAVVPLYLHGASEWLGGRRAAALRVFVVAGAVFAVWAGLHATLMGLYDYSYGHNPSVNFREGGYFVHWMTSLSPSVAAFALFAEFGALWILAPAGWFLAPTPLRHAVIAAAPAAVALVYVQQPDRALWNFHFLVTPLAALVLARVPVPLAWSTLALFVVANLRVGAQFAFVPAARITLVASAVLAVACCGWVWRQGRLAVPARSWAGQ